MNLTWDLIIYELNNKRRNYTRLTNSHFVEVKFQAAYSLLILKENH
jgi:hypothetical protein